MNPKRFLCPGLLIAALMVAACGPEATPEQTATPTPLPPTDTPAPTAITEVPMGFTEEGSPYRGNPDAPVTMLEYSEFQ
jgi:protein-disulfide isomerase